MRYFCLALFIAVVQPLHAQTEIERIWEPALTYSHKVTDFWNLSAQVAAFQSTEQLERVEASLFAVRRFNPTSSAGVGYLYRMVTPLDGETGYEHRFTLQYGFQAPWGVHQVSHRVRAEERIRPSGNVHRFRYRAGLRTPLQGERLDPGERYLLTQNEVLGSFSDNPFSGENRISVHLGFLLENRQRVEVGLQHRAERLFTDSDVNHVLILSTVWHFTN
jgi:hypothetical protein